MHDVPVIVTVCSSLSFMKGVIKEKNLYVINVCYAYMIKVALVQGNDEGMRHWVRKMCIFNVHTVLGLLTSCKDHV